MSFSCGAQVDLLSSGSFQGRWLDNTSPHTHTRTDTHTSPPKPTESYSFSFSRVISCICSLTIFLNESLHSDRSGYISGLSCGTWFKHYEILSVSAASPPPANTTTITTHLSDSCTRPLPCLLASASTVKLKGRHSRERWSLLMLLFESWGSGMFDRTSWIIWSHGEITTTAAAMPLFHSAYAAANTVKHFLLPSSSNSFPVCALYTQPGYWSDTNLLPKQVKQLSRNLMLDSSRSALLCL